ncbi:integrase core domain-containing protein [Rhodovulum sulfidophilum]|uniref:integrase core domain-containing protein n=1 Tax=Rhodovulum sulfidophilum TaxID=35806 RepID=UPI0019237470|nr:transposase [Rhodovulum sulfidophilum]
MPAHVTPDFSRPGPPTDNGFIEAVTGNLRMASVNARRFISPADAREDPEDRRRHNTENRKRARIQAMPHPDGAAGLRLEDKRSIPVTGGPAPRHRTPSRGRWP